MLSQKNLKAFTLRFSENIVDGLVFQIFFQELVLFPKQV